jgi:Asp-tRNA(Asn)/Glu-tRNA(Gln) amidotransferase B subunit
VEEVVERYKEGKISKKEASQAIRDLVQGSTEDALERIQEEGAAEQSRDQEEQEA